MSLDYPITTINLVPNLIIASYQAHLFARTKETLNPASNDDSCNQHFKKNQLFYIGDSGNAHKVLVDTGIEISVILSTPELQQRKLLYKIYATNEAKIDMYIEKSFTLNFEIQHRLSWIFIQANLK